MKLPPELDKSIRKSFEELIKKGNFLLQNFDRDDANCIADFKELITSSYTLIKRVNCGEFALSDIEQYNDADHPHHSQVSIVVGRLKGVKFDYENGLCRDLVEQITAELSSDYMGQAKALLDEGIQDQYDHVPAAVLCGAVLENRLRSYSENLDPPIETVKPNGESKTLGALIGELDRIKAFDKQTRKLLKAWADIRNAAAHGKFDEFTREQVKLMLLGVNGFLASHL